MVGHWTHPDVAVFLQILRCDHCFKERSMLHQKYTMRNGGMYLLLLPLLSVLLVVIVVLLVLV